MPKYTHVTDLPGYRIGDVTFNNGYCNLCGALVGAWRTPGHEIPQHYDDRAWKINHRLFHAETYSRKQAEAMSAVLWCDNGNHPFKAGIPGSQTASGTEYDRDSNPHDVRMDICPEHTPAALAENRVKELEARLIRAETPARFPATDTPRDTPEYGSRTLGNDSEHDSYGL